MRIALTALTPLGAQDVVVSGDDAATAGQVAAALRQALSGDGELAQVISLSTGLTRGTSRQETLWLGGQAVDPAAPATAVLREGALVTLDPRAGGATSLTEPSGLIELRLTGGPAAGRVHRLGIGAVTVGAAPECGIRLTGDQVPPHALRVVIGRAGAGLQALVEPLTAAAGGDGPLLLDGEPVTATREWPPGRPLQVGAHVLALAPVEPPDAHLSPVPGGGLAYNRPPRLLPSRRPRRIELPAEPKRAERARLQLLTALLPLAFGLVMVKVMHSAYYALFMLMSPVMAVATWLSERRRGRTDYKKKLKEYRARMAQLDSVIARELAADEAERRAAFPDPAEILLTATGPRRRLWERRATDPDALHLRVGLASLRANIEFALERGSRSDEELPPVPSARNVPIPLPLPDLGVIGLAGAVAASRGLARWLVAQAAALHSPRDLEIVVLTADRDAGRQWNWARWLPHCVPQRGQECVALIGNDPETAGRRVTELVAEVSARLDAASDAGGFGRLGGEGYDPSLGPRILVVLDGARLLRGLPGMPKVLAAARQAGICAVCIDESERLLPEECATVLSWEDGGDWLTMRGGGCDVYGRVLADQVSTRWADRVARTLAPVRDVSRDDTEAMVPTSARLLDLIQLPDPAPEDIAERWRQYGRTTAGAIGVSADGPFTIDLRTDGPHGLVAGTTGAGKSELLQTIIASLAVVNRPESMTFVLIDYKGGSAFKDCARLPHTVGMVSDLDGHLTERALASLSAELKRREEILLEAGAKDIEDYWDTRRMRPDLQPLPRLVLIIDEFASLVAELPDFVTGLVGIAQRGRSLGVHLLLATQRPAGVVSADIRANTNLRIALRVTGADESADVIDTRDAAFIAKSTPGRCYVRSGAGTPVAVQSARIGGRRPGSGPAEAAAHAVPVPWRGVGRPLPAAGPVQPEDDGTMATDLSVLVDAIAGAAAKLAIPAQRSPWLPPLPELITLAELPPPAAAGGEVPPIPWGLTDMPARQAREPLTFDLPHGGHLVIAGGPHSGRSTALRTIAGSVAAHAAPADVHIYGLDCGTGALLPLSALPHCGAVVTRDQTERVERLIGKLRGEIMRRQQLLATGGFAGLAEQRAAAAPQDRLPWLLFLVDWWEGFASAYENYDFGRVIDAMLQTLREGAAVGLRAVVTTDRAALIGQTSTVFSQRMLLRLTDRSDAALAALNERSLPGHQPPGRIMFEGTPLPLEAQIALLDEDPSGPAQVAALRRLGEQSLARHGQPPRGQRPLRVDQLPSRITASETWQVDPDFAPPSPLWALAGVGGDELAPQGLDVCEDGPGLVVAGPPRSGRSTTLLTMAQSLLARGTPVVLITPRRSPLRQLAGAGGVLAVLGADASAGDLTEAIGERERYAVLADDAELLVNGPLSDPLEKILRSGRDAEHGVILAGPPGDLTRAYSGFVPAALKSRAGILVTVDSPGDGDLFNIRLPRNAGPGSLGRGLLIRPGTVMAVQLALPD